MDASTPSYTFTMNVLSPELIREDLVAKVWPDGTVEIDWLAVDKVLSDPSMKGSPSLGYVKLMAAIRDGTWKPIIRKQP